MVYVGDIEFRYGRMIMFHMVADTLDELNEMADKIGVNRKWIQVSAHPLEITHYDICKSKKRLALAFGAEEMPDRQIVVKFKKV